MIGWLLDAVRQVVLDPQAGAAVPAERRAVVQQGGLQTHAVSIVVGQTTTAPLRGSHLIGGGCQLAHAIQLEVTVEDGDLERARTRRDAVVLDLVMRALLDPTLGGAESADGAQVLSGLEWEVAYADLSGGTRLAAFATVVFTAVADLSPARLRP